MNVNFDFLDRQYTSQRDVDDAEFFKKKAKLNVLEDEEPEKVRDS